ncbi:M20 metallopeptidase family protein [Desulfogranum mediterraneum]|uniref:M20 metallopeptidase family protein n=1 Tax=Desulfogranum mediterraneum TaxID=160661 RepID=UPI000688F9E0|nr:M20 family metallopeptidase [Desulfogranum mediterraneum]
MSVLKSTVESYRSTIFEYRHALHRIPETAFSERRTSAFVEEQLSKLGLELETGIAQYGLTGLMRGEGPGAKDGKTLMIRADMDALAVTEETGLPWASTHEGLMHACGHDGHMAMVMGAALVLNTMKDRLNGRIKFLFQPAEEGPGGAKPMIEAGVLDNPRVDYALGAHLWPALEQGKIGIKEGPLMAAMDFFELTISGKGGHGAMPHLCIDPVDTAAQVINGLQRITSRQMSPISPTVVTIGSIHGGSSYNIIPDTVQLQGTTRTFDRDIWVSWPQRMEQIIKGICESMGAEYSLNYQPGYPPTLNDAEMAELAGQCAIRVVGEEHVTSPEPTMGGEDMSFYLEKTKGCFIFLGTGRPGCAPLHNSSFDFDEEVLLTGVELFAEMALTLLR